MSHILLTDEFVYASFPYDPGLVSEIKARVDGRQWDPKMRVWKAPWFAASTMIEVVQHWYPDVVVEDQRVTRRPRGSIDPARDGWACQMFRALPASLRRPAYLALTRVLHPDAGGDNRAAQALNDAYEQCGKSS